jgi:hypothetical protein
MIASVLLVLWDVDHTLIETRGVGFEIYAAAFGMSWATKLARAAARCSLTCVVIVADGKTVH